MICYISGVSCVKRNRKVRWYTSGPLNVTADRREGGVLCKVASRVMNVLGCSIGCTHVD